MDTAPLVARLWRGRGTDKDGRHPTNRPVRAETSDNGDPIRFHTESVINAT